MSAIRINGSRIKSSLAEVSIKQRAKTVLVEAYRWAGHQSSAAEGPIQKVRIVRPSLAEALAELKARWMQQAGNSSYIGFGGQFRHFEHLTRDEVLEVMDDVQESLEEAGLVEV